VRVWPSHRWQNGVPADAIPDTEATARWLLVEWRKDGAIKYALSNLPPDSTIEQAVRWWKERWQVERGYEQLKGELGLDGLEGRSWNGFHHHAAMTCLAYGFLALERRRAQDEVDTAVAEGRPPGEVGRGA
jgi:SRSO17 transposase